VTVGRHGVRPEWIAVIKRGLELRGRAVGPVRRPMLPLTEEVDALVKQVVSNMSFA
jgi:dihydrodipicolinate synthase/N-acetylneuraminate lyase